LYVGTVEERKNISTVLNAWQQVNKRLAGGYQLVLIGKTNSTMALRLPPGVQYLGYCTDKEKHQWYRGASAFLYPSFYEGFGFPVLEAMTYGVPVVTSFSTALPEVAREAAILVDPYNVYDVAEGLFAALTDPQVRRHLMSVGPALVEQYSWQNAARGLLDIINTLK
jgi:glycosyltransferase involved in cell wall biosynthesis